MDHSCLVTGDDKLLVFGSRDLSLVDASPRNKKYRELSCIKNIVAVKNKEGDVVCLSVRPR